MKLNKYVSFVLGLLLLSFGIILAVKANYGVTVATSPSYVLSERFEVPSFGVFNYSVQGCVFILTIIVLRKFELRYLLSFGTSVVFGYTIDFFAFLMKEVHLIGHASRISFFIASIIIISAGLVFFYRSHLPILPFDVFVREVSAKYDVKLSRFKLGFDITMCSIAVVLSILFFGELRGVSVGTLISAFTIGPTIGVMMGYFDKLFVIRGGMKSVNECEQL